MAYFVIDAPGYHGRKIRVYSKSPSPPTNVPKIKRVLQGPDVNLKYIDQETLVLWLEQGKWKEVVVL
jgi:hypothetical protein